MENRNIIKKIIIIFTGFLLAIFAAVSLEYYDENKDISPINTETLIEHGIDSADKLMITAHPDDEIIWGGGHLMDKGYFIVVITNGKNKIRKKEFESVLESSGNSGIILDYPDKNFGFRSKWTSVRDDISKDIKKVMDYKDWKLIVTHNEAGEYGHIHHKMTHEIVNNVFESEKKSNTKLYFFGKYYKKTDIAECEKNTLKISKDRLEYKEKLLELYTSQARTIKNLSHMNCYEDWEEKINDRS